MAPAGPGPPERLPFLDGVRALAVLAVLAYHSGLPGLRVGGSFGVDAFFVLSGFLITSLLLEETRTRGTIGLVAFWGRRARRLFPALAVMLVAVDVYVTFAAPPGLYSGFRQDAFSVVAYFSNWHFINVGSDYFAASSSQSLLTHTWSLAIEEQFYVAWPLLVLVLTRRRPLRGTRALLAVSAGGALVSAAWMAYLYRAGASPSRLYYGTDTHAQSLLVGAALAAALSQRPLRLESRRWATAIGVSGAVAAVGIGWMVTHVGSGSGFADQGGFLCFAVLMAGLLLSVLAQPAGMLARVLSIRPLVYIGTISYGMYLWYFPLFDVITRAHTGLRGYPLFAVRATADVAAAVASFYLVERPVRTGRLWRLDPDRPRVSLRPIGLSAVALGAAFGIVAVDTSGAQPVTAVAALPALPVASTGPKTAVRVMVVGDSTGLTLGLGLADVQVARTYGVSVLDEATLGCGVAISADVREHGETIDTAQPCNAGAPASVQWPAHFRAAVDALHPDVVLIVAGRFEVLNRQASSHGPWQNITQAADAGYVARQLGLAVSIGSSRGAAVEVATAPCYSSGEQPSGATWPEDNPARLAAYNRLAAAAVEAHPGRTALLDLGGILCPRGNYRQTIDGVTVRAPDGIHYPFFNIAQPRAEDPDSFAETEAFGRWISARIMPSIVAAGTAARHPA
ncbi:MAG TPA: acyltransferase [Acidimicrobiales bacterium]|jgi:peptidoglycan/LPS O-acetylase OafA/YrhL